MASSVPLPQLSPSPAHSRGGWILMFFELSSNEVKKRKNGKGKGKGKEKGKGDREEKRQKGEKCNVFEQKRDMGSKESAIFKLKFWEAF